jgi:hypothetical protein
MPSRAIANFMKQQGFVEEPSEACDMHFEGLYFQPRIVFPAVVVAILLQVASIPASAGLHFALSALLWWNTLRPSLNPFELAYNRWVARPKGRLEPRRMAQGMAAAFNLRTGLALLSGMTPLAWALQAMLVVAFSALLFGRFCLGAYVYHLLKGRVAFANSTLPWA